MKGEALIYRAPGVETPERIPFTEQPKLDFWQKAVGGFIEVVPDFASITLDGVTQPCIAFCNEEGKLNGLPQNHTELAEWLYKVISEAILKEGEKYYRTTKGSPALLRRHASIDFRMGMALRINQRLHDMARALEPIAKTASGTALVVVRGAAVQKAFDDLGLRFGKPRSGLHHRHGDAYERGRAAGDQVGLNRPVGSATRGLLR